MGRAAVIALAAALTLAPSSWAQAQDEDEEETDESEVAEDEDGEGDDEGDSEDEDAEDEEGEDGDETAEEGEAGEEGEEGAGETAATEARKWYFGPFVRYVFVPAFMLELFLEEAPTVANLGFGIAADYRPKGNDGAQFRIGIAYTSYAFEDPFRATGDPVEDTEWLDSNVGLVHVTGSILWSSEVVAKKLFFEYGLGADFGIVTGGIERNEARLNDASNEWEPCQGVGNAGATPQIPGDLDFAYCEPPNPASLPTNAYDQDGAHYGVDEERVPPVALMPILPHLGLRFEPMEELAFKLEASIFQLWIGLSAAYAPKL